MEHVAVEAACFSSLIQDIRYELLPLRTPGIDRYHSLFGCFDVNRPVSYDLHPDRNLPHSAEARGCHCFLLLIKLDATCSIQTLIDSPEAVASGLVGAQYTWQLAHQNNNGSIHVLSSRSSRPNRIQ